ncbi:MAG: hypothetical protein ACKV2U_17305 [Bryobacteraceae bacterium]
MITFTDFVRLPPPADPEQAAYKDWLHLNVVDTADGWVGVFNASLHGSPRDARSLALGTALIYHPSLGWIGNMEVTDLASASIQPAFIGVRRMGMASSPAPAAIQLSVDRMDERVSAQILCTAVQDPILIELPLPFGRGWISWNVVPRLKPQGELSVDGVALPLNLARAYHDHNWGRWYWGDDIGWEWGYFGGASVSVVFARTSNRAHSSLGAPWLSVHRNGISRRFPEPLVACHFEGSWQGRLRRLPGAMAALHQDRARPSLPRRVTILGAEPPDELTLTFEAVAAAQLIAGDPAGHGYSFIHQIAGTFQMEGRLGGESIYERGSAIFEYVD